MGDSEYTCQICGTKKYNGWGFGRDEICDHCYNNAKKNLIDDSDDDITCIVCNIQKITFWNSESNCDYTNWYSDSKEFCKDCYLKLTDKTCFICGIKKKIILINGYRNL